MTDKILDEDQTKQMEFVMKVGYQMKIFLNNCLIDAFNTHEERSAAFYSTLVNFIANCLSEVSEGDNLKRNIKEVIDGLNDWLEKKDHLLVKYDPNTNTVKKEGIH